MTGSAAITHWNGVILPLSMHGAGRKSAVTQLSSLLPGLGAGDISGPRTGFTSAHANCPGAGNSTKKNLHWNRKIDSKKTGCHCQVIIKLYPHTDTILGNYRNAHDHEVGSDNIAYTRMSGVAREQIKSMLVQKVDHKEIVRN